MSNTVAASTVRDRVAVTAALRASWYCCQASAAATAASTSTPPRATSTTRLRGALPVLVLSAAELDRRQPAARRTVDRASRFPPRRVLGARRGPSEPSPGRGQSQRRGRGTWRPPRPWRARWESIGKRPQIAAAALAPVPLHGPLELRLRHLRAALDAML